MQQSAPAMTTKPVVSFLIYKAGTGHNNTLEKVRQQHVRRAKYIDALGYAPFRAALFHTQAAHRIGTLQAQ